jgi:hypothetical protein
MARSQTGRIGADHLRMHLPVASPRECIADAMEWKLPSPLLPIFLHEITHWWCLTAPIGHALAWLVTKSKLAMYEVAADDRPATPEALGDIWRAHASLAILRPLLEGLALFAEHDLEPGQGSVLSEPIRLAFPFFMPRSPEMARADLRHPEVLDAHIRAMLTQDRISEDGVKRKTKLLTTPLGDPSGYLSGYLLVRDLYERAKLKSARAHDRDLFLMYLRSYLFEDYELARRLLDQPLPDKGRPGRSLFLRIGARLRSLVSDTLDSRLKNYEECVLSDDRRSGCLDSKGEDWDGVRDRLEREIRRLPGMLIANRAAALSVGASLAHRSAILIAAADGVFSSTRGGRCRFEFEDGPIELNMASPNREPGETRARFVACFMPEVVRDAMFGPTLEEDWMVFACFSEEKMIWWSFLRLGSKGLHGLTKFPSEEIEMHFRTTMESVRFASAAEEFSRLSDELLGDIVNSDMAAPRAALAAGIDEFYARRALTRVRSKLQDKCRAALSENGFWGPLKIGSEGNGDAVRALAVLGLCAAVGTPARDVEQRLREFNLDPTQVLAKIALASRQYGLPLCNLGEATAARGGIKTAIDCFP